MGAIIFILLLVTGMAWLILHGTGRNRVDGDELIHPNWDGPNLRRR